MDEGVSDTERAILDAALDEVLAHGIRRTTVTDIARRSGVARQTLYRYWPDAQSLYAALITRELLAMLPPMAQRAATLDALVARLVDTTERIRALPLLERLRDTDPELFARYVFERIGASQRALHAELARAIARGQGEGYVRPGDSARLAAVLLLAGQASIQSAPIVAEWVAAPAWRAELARLFRGYLAPEAS